MTYDEPEESRRHRVGSTAVLLVLLSAAGPTAVAAEPLHARIDQLIEQSSGSVAAPVAGDAEFLRRLSLDLTGIPPSVAELRQFLSDQSPAKRQAAVDRLLASPEHARHMAVTFDVMLMERRPNQSVSADDWHNYLLKAFRENKPYNQLAREILAADGTDANLRPAVRFYLDRAAEPNLLTRDVGRIFFGRDLQCAQCHDHPLIDDYHQADYHGLYAFFVPGFTFAVPNNPAYYAERAGTDVAFESVFVKGVRHVTAPKLPGGVQIAEPAFYPGDEYQVRPAENVRPVPKFSRRAKLAEEATGGTNRAFNENIANRLWAHVMGRGLVHPVDLHHSGNPPSHPELLQLLGEEFAAMKFDVKAFLRELALTKTYQRAIDLPPDLIDRSPQAAAFIAQSEQRRDQLKGAAAQSLAAYTKAAEEWDAAGKAAAPARSELDQAIARSAEVVKKLDEAQKGIAPIEGQLAAKQDVARALSEAVAKAQEALKKLPQDQELAQAAQKFVERHNQVAAEVASLTKTLEEKKAALKPVETELAASRQPIDAARAKLAPLAEAARQKEQVMLAARQQMMADGAALQSIELRLESARRLAALKPLHDKSVASAAAVPPAQTKLAEARAAVETLAAVVSQKETELKTSQQEQAKAGEALKTVQAEHTRREQILKTVEAAASQSEAALKQLPGDAALTDASQKLRTKAGELKTALTEHQKQLDAQTLIEKAARDKVAAAMQAHQTALAQMTQQRQQVSAAEQVAGAAGAQAQADAGALEQAKRQAADDASRAFTAASLKPLTPEQMCWSILQVTGFVERQRQAEEAELNKASPLSEEAKKDPAQLAARQAEIEQRVYDKLLKGNAGAFVGVYAAAAGSPQTDFFATADQALFAANGGTINGWIAPAGGNVAERMISQADPKAGAEDLYLTVLSRPPTEQEVADVTAYLAARPSEKPACVQELIWSLMTSAEFRFNH